MRSPFHSFHQSHLIWRGGDVEGGGPALVDAPLYAIDRLLLLHLHRVTQAQRPEKQILVFLPTQTYFHFTNAMASFVTMLQNVFRSTHLFPIVLKIMNYISQLHSGNVGYHSKREFSALSLF